MADKSNRRRATLVRSRTGYRVAAERGSGGEQITVTAPDGRLCLRIRLLADGPVIEVQSPSIHMVSAGALRLDCESLTVNAEREIALNAGGRLQQTAGGDVRVQAGGTFDCEADAQRLWARVGDLALEANDDVSLEGERVLLNSPKSVAPARRPVPVIAPAPAPAALPSRRRGARRG
jgi:hypothetical protein